MTGEEEKADVRTKRFHQRSKSSIEAYTLPMHKDLIKDDVTPQMKEPLKGGNGKKDSSRSSSSSWFKSSKKPPSQPNPYPDLTSDLKLVEEELKPPPQPHRVVQGLYRDDDGGPSPRILVTANSAARDAVQAFAKDFVAQMKSGDSDELLALESQMRRHLHLTELSSLSPTSPPVGLKFLAQAYVAHHFFSDFENASFGLPNAGEKPWEVQDHMHRCFAQFQRYKTRSQTVVTLLENENQSSNELSFLSQFCVKKFQTIVPSGGAFFGGDCRLGQHPDTPFYRSFLGAAVSVWLLQRLAFSFEQKIVLIVPTPGDAFQRRFMTPVVPGVGDSECEENNVALEIALTVFPGFRVSESIVESLVYVVESPSLLLLKINTSKTPVETSEKPLKGGVLQKIKSKFIRKKTLDKSTTAMAANAATVTPAPAPPPSSIEQVPSSRESAPLLEESAPSIGKGAPLPRGEAAAALEEEKPSPPTDDDDGAEQNPTTVVTKNPPIFMSSPRLLQPTLNVETTDDSSAPPSSVVAASLDEGAGDERLYIPRAEKSMLLQQSLLRSQQQLSSVD